MRNTKDVISIRQLMVTIYVGLQSPFIRQLPHFFTASGGRGVWLAPLVAVIPASLFTVLLYAVMKSRNDGEGLAELIIRMLGKTVGKAVCAIFGLWFVLYTAFHLRSGAERLLSSLYFDGEVWLMMLVILGAALIAASGRVCSLMRTSEVYLLVIVFAVAFVLLLSTNSIELEYLWPVTSGDAGIIVRAGALTTNVCAVSFSFWFLAGRIKKEPKEKRTVFRWLFILLLSVMAVLVIVCGMLPQSYLVNLQNPFFIVIRNLSLFSAVE